MKVLFIEPPREFWFVMGEYLPPPFGIIQLAAYLEREVEDAEIEVLDCTAQQLGWNEIGRKIESFNPDIVAASAFATCNVYLVLRTFEIAKNVNPEILTVTGGQHFTATSQESLEEYPEIDVIVRGEGEETLTELVKNSTKKSQFSKIRGLSFRHNGKIIHNKPRPPIKDLNDLPIQDTTLSKTLSTGIISLQWLVVMLHMPWLKVQEDVPTSVHSAHNGDTGVEFGDSRSQNELQMK